MLGPIVLGPLVKVCGATSAAEVAAAADGGADAVGLWSGVVGGLWELAPDRLAPLAAEARRAGVEPVLVTLLGDAVAVARTATDADISWVQLHAFQPPAMVAELRRLLPGHTRITKVVHVRGVTCLEARFLVRYGRSGVDSFLVDSMSPDGQVGSTGSALHPGAAAAVLDASPVPVMLAGGLDATNADLYAAHRSHGRYLGADFDSAARGAGGRLDRELVERIVARWRTTDSRPGRLAPRLHPGE